VGSSRLVPYFEGDGEAEGDADGEGEGEGVGVGVGRRALLATGVGLVARFGVAIGPGPWLAK
jgi:hypothetical protein